MAVKNNYRHTLAACYLGYITQSVINTFPPLLFLTFREEYGLTLEAVTLLVTINFTVQLLVDLLSVKFVDSVGYQGCLITAHLMCAAGFVLLSLLPGALGNPYGGLVIATICYAIGGGMIEVLVSPVVEACPTERKSASMSLLHSFFCWGCVLVVLVSTAFFAVFGRRSWHVLACLWAAIPLGNMLYFSRVPIPVFGAGGPKTPVRSLLRNRLFWVLLLLMLCAGAAEQSMSQWASAFAEGGLGLSKTAGDLLGPCVFSAMMGLSRVAYAKLSTKAPLQRFMLMSGALCIASYLLAIFAPSPLLGLVGCSLCGLSVGILWPGTFSIAAVALPGGGAALFALLSLAGDVGCSAGPTLVGMVSGACGDNLKSGLLAALTFPVLMILGLLLIRKSKENTTVREV